jgi:CubicO group peptidase (beta-lactamase class C family)
MLRKLAFSTAGVLLIATGAALAYAPYLPRLMVEGYPPLMWPASGSHALIAGKANPMPLQRRPTADASLSASLAKAFAEAEGKALLVSPAGTLEVEHYADGVGPDSKFNSFSMAKSLVGALIFKALAEGKLSGLDQTVGEILPDFGDEKIRAVTLKRLLTMRSGVLFERETSIGEHKTKDLEAALFNPFGPMAQLHAGGLAHIQRQLTADAGPGSQFRYQNVNTAILGAVLAKLYGQPLSALLARKLWRPAGANDAYWRQHGDGGSVSAYCCIFATPRDWLRIGHYLSRNGTVAEPFLPPELWRQLFGLEHQPAELRAGVYGYHLRHDVLDRPGKRLQGKFAYMLGQGGQVLYMMPQEDLVVLRFGEKMQLLHSTLYDVADTLATR